MTHPNGEGGITATCHQNHHHGTAIQFLSQTANLRICLHGNRENGMHQLGQAILNETIDSIPFLGSIFNS